MAKHLWGVSKPVTDTPTAIEFPINNAAGPGPTLFAFTGSNLIQFAPMTLIWNAYFNQQDGYYCTFFYDRNDWDGDYGDAVSANSYVGCHPYPWPGGGSSTPGHKFEISAEGTDYVTDKNGHDTTLTTAQWYRQAVRITLVSGKPLIEFFWNLAAGTNYVIEYQFSNTANTGSNPGLAFGATCWTAPQNFQILETMYARLRNLQQYASALSTGNISLASACNTDAEVAALGLSPWYYNVNLKPTDISDKSGNGHNPAWVNSSYTGQLWTGP